jgi:hypothetical protein
MVATATDGQLGCSLPWAHVTAHGCKSCSYIAVAQPCSISTYGIAQRYFRTHFAIEGDHLQIRHALIQLITHPAAYHVDARVADLNRHRFSALWIRLDHLRIPPPHQYIDAGERRFGRCFVLRFGDHLVGGVNLIDT